MIIELTDGFYDVDFSSDTLSRNGIDTICLSVARGEHFLIASRMLINRLESDQSLSITTRGILSWIRSEYAFLAGMLRNFRYRIYVEATSGLPKKMPNNTWLLPISHVAEKGIRPTVLLGENSNDGDIYVHAAEHYRINIKNKDVLINICPRNGNGASVSQELARITRDASEFCICITDSDRLHPLANEGTIATATKKIAENSDWVVTHHSPTSRELENALPSTLVYQAMEDIGLPNLSDFENCSKRLDEETISHADLKHGTSLHWVSSRLKNSPTYDFWEKKSKKAFYDYDASINCLKESKCTAESCNCYVVPGIAKDLATHVHDLMKSASSHIIYQQAKSSYNFEDWLRIGREVFEAGAAPRRMRI